MQTAKQTLLQDISGLAVLLGLILAASQLGG